MVIRSLVDDLGRFSVPVLWLVNGAGWKSPLGRARSMRRDGAGALKRCSSSRLLSSFIYGLFLLVCLNGIPWLIQMSAGQETALIGGRMTGIEPNSIRAMSSNFLLLDPRRFASKGSVQNSRSDAPIRLQRPGTPPKRSRHGRG